MQAGEEETEAITLGGFATLCLLNFTQMSLCSIKKKSVVFKTFSVELE